MVQELRRGQQGCGKVARSTRYGRRSQYRAEQTLHASKPTHARRRHLEQLRQPRPDQRLREPPGKTCPSRHRDHDGQRRYALGRRVLSGRRLRYPYRAVKMSFRHRTADSYGQFWRLQLCEIKIATMGVAVPAAGTVFAWHEVFLLSRQSLWMRIFETDRSRGIDL